MRTTLFTGYGIEILTEGSKFWIRYDAGEIAVQMREDEVSALEAAEAQRDEQAAYYVILGAQGRKPPEV